MARKKIELVGRLVGRWQNGSAHEKTEIVFDLGFYRFKKYTRQDSNLQPSVPKARSVSIR